MPVSASNPLSPRFVCVLLFLFGHALLVSSSSPLFSTRKCQTGIGQDSSVLVAVKEPAEQIEVTSETSNGVRNTMAIVIEYTDDKSTGVLLPALWISMAGRGHILPEVWFDGWRHIGRTECH